MQYHILTNRFICDLYYILLLVNSILWALITLILWTSSEHIGPFDSSDWQLWELFTARADGERMLTPQQDLVVCRSKILKTLFVGAETASSDRQSPVPTASERDIKTITSKTPISRVKYGPVLYGITGPDLGRMHPCPATRSSHVSSGAIRGTLDPSGQGCILGEGPAKLGSSSPESPWPTKLLKLGRAEKRPRRLRSGYDWRPNYASRGALRRDWGGVREVERWDLAAFEKLLKAHFGISPEAYLGLLKRHCRHLGAPGFWHTKRGNQGAVTFV